MAPGSQRLPRLVLLQILHHLLQAADHGVDEIGHLVDGVVGKSGVRAPRRRLLAWCCFGLLLLHLGAACRAAPGSRG